MAATIFSGMILMALRVLDVLDRRGDGAGALRDRGKRTVSEFFWRWRLRVLRLGRLWRDGAALAIEVFLLLKRKHEAKT